MRELAHHTKDKGDQGVGYVISALLSRNIKVALPLSEHLPFDIIAISPTGQLKKVSVKYRTAKAGCVEVRLESNWSNANRFCSRKYEKGEVDAYAIYCPDTRKCYFLNDKSIGHQITLRTSVPANGQTKAVKMADDYLDPMSMFS